MGVDEGERRESGEELAGVEGTDGGAEQLKQELTCPRSQLCSSIQCTLCLERLLEWSCWTLTDYVIIVTCLILIAYIVLVSAATIYVARAALRIAHTLGFIVFLPIRLLHSTYKFTVRNALECWQNRKKEEPHLPLFRQERRRFGLVAATIFCTLLTSAHGCSEVVSIKTTQEKCTEKEGLLTCLLSDTTLLHLRPIGQQVCLAVRNGSTVVGTIGFKVDTISRRCEELPLFYTRDHILAMDLQICGDVFSPGSCDGITCSAVSATDKLEQLSTTANQAPGFTACGTSCECVSCGCTSCSPSCIISRLYALPTTAKIYQSFTCPQWTTTITITASITQKEGSHSEELIIHPGKPLRWRDTTLNILSITNPFLPILSYQYLWDGERTSIVETSAAGQFIANSVGQLQCETHSDAESFSCAFRPTICQCSYAMNTRNCDCPSGNMSALMKQPLPLRTSTGMSLNPDGDSIYAYTPMSTLLLQATFEDLPLSAVTENNTCAISASTARGCYDCPSGAEIDVVCRSSGGEEVAHLICVDGEKKEHSRLTRCTKEGNADTLHFPGHAPSFSLACLLSCPGGQQELEISGTLEYLHKEGEEFGSHILRHSLKATDGFIGNFISSVSNFVSTYFDYLKIAILAILIFVCIVFLGPPLINYLS